jgi:Bacteriocin-protection, YdeI or OmpD-Associated/Domain of unknown function (DUF1905)
VGALRFHTTLIPHGPATAIVLDDAQVAELGEGAKRFPVVATVNGYTWRTSVAKMGGEYLVGLSKAVREAADVGLESEVDVVLELDSKPREVEVPPALAAALEQHPDVKEKFDALAFTHRKEYARWIEEAKRDETRAKRVETALEMLHQGRTRS